MLLITFRHILQPSEDEEKAVRKLKSTLYDIKETILDYIYDLITDPELSEIVYGIVSMVSSFAGCGIGVWLFWLILRMLHR